MGFFQKFQLGKTYKRAAIGYATGGNAGAGRALLQGVIKATARSAPSNPSGGGSLFVQGQQVMNSSFTQPSASFPNLGGGGGGGIPIRAGAMSKSVVTGDVYNALLKIADRLGVRILNPQSVVRIGRGLVAKLIRFSRATPGLTIVSMLLNLGLTAIEANTVVGWFSTAGKRSKRIRVTNVKALNRSVRRLEGFRRLANRVEKALGRRGVARSSAVRRRCGKCRKSPCSC